MDKKRIIDICDRVIEGCFYVLIPSVTFSISLVEIASTLMIAVWILRVILAGNFKDLNIWPVKFLAAYFIWVLLSCFNSDYPKESFRGVFKVIEYSLIFMASATTPWAKGVIKRFVYVLAGSVTLTCLNGLVQYFTGEGLIRHRTLIPEDELRRISSSFVHPNDLGVYLLVGLVVFMSFLFLRRDEVMRKALVVWGFLLGGVTFFLTKSRGAWLSFVAAVLAFGALKAKRVLAIFIVLLVLGAVFMPGNVRDRMAGLTDFNSGTTWERLMLWKGTFNMVKERPFLGFGVNTYSRNFPKYKPKDYPDVRYAHNCYLHMASEIGVPGVVFFIGFIVSVIVSAWRRLFSIAEGERRALSAGLIAALVGFSVNAVVDTHFYSLTLSVYFNLLMGFCFAITRYAKIREN